MALVDSQHFRLVIVGGGSAGLAAADFAAHLGVSVAVIERDRVGGDCTWSGCIPSKALLQVAEVCHTVRGAHGFGVNEAAATLDFAAAMAYVRNARARVYRYETPEVLAARGVRVLHGEARFLDPWTLEVAGQRVRGDAFLLATGAEPAIPAIPGLTDVPYFTYQTIFDLAALPPRLAILGAGPIGVELAQAYQRLGSQVVLVDRHDRVAALADPEASAVLQRALERDAVQLHLGVRVHEVRRAGSEVVLRLDTHDVAADALLVAAGRRPNVAALDLDRAGVAWSDAGIEVDSHLRTRQPHIYACGDAIGSFQFTHYAGWQAVMAARNALLPGTARGQAETVPWTLFTEPKVAQVGLDERQARERYGSRLRVTRWPIERIDRAVTEGETDGFLKLLSRSNGRLVGATIVCRRAGELANEMSLALSQRLTVADLARAIHVYPTYGFALQQAAAQATYARLGSGCVGVAVRFLARHWPTRWDGRSVPWRMPGRQYTAGGSRARGGAVASTAFPPGGSP